MNSTPLITQGGLRGTCRTTEIPLDTALDEVWAGVDTCKGGLFVSNFEVPDRYARWDIGFVNPPVEVLLRGRQVVLNALNGEGRRLLPLLAPALREHPHLSGYVENENTLAGQIILPPPFFPEEERSRQPSMFTVLRALREQLACEQPDLGFFGAFGYDMVFSFETLRQQHSRDPQQVDCHLFLATEVVVVDRRKELARKLVFDFESPQGPTRAGGQGGESFKRPAPAPVEGLVCDHPPGEFETKVGRIREGCKAGDFFEVVLSQSFQMSARKSPTELFRTICSNNPSPYSFLINMGEEQLIGASPEMYVRVNGRRVETSPISGTVTIGDSPMETAEKIKELISSEKEESELTMCTDVDRNDMTRVCVPGTVRLIGRRLIETYSRLVHTVDHVEGELAGGFDALDAFASHLWACTVTGSPKPAALQIIEDLERSPRRWYAGAIGYLSVNGDLNTGMTLRTVHLEGGQASVRAGATLLYESEPAAEEQETRIKASAFLEATLGDGSAPKRNTAYQSTGCGMGRKVLFVDFRDSFVHTLASYVRLTGAEVVTVRQEFPESLLDELQPDLVFLSPGPGTPTQRGVGEVVRRALARALPLFGVCLGHQGLAEHFGAELGILERPMHGRPSPVAHGGQALFAGLETPLTAGRYHSLYVKAESLPPELEVLARAPDGLIMALRHRSLPVLSCQFHPESILTLRQHCGQKMIDNVFTQFVDVARPR